MTGSEVNGYTCGERGRCVGYRGYLQAGGLAASGTSPPLLYILNAT